VPEQKIYDIFIKSKQLNNYRDFESMEKCGKCPLMPICRGCPAIAYAVNGSYFSPDPQCWRE
jgi:radical SAM protein with 4Fe4S-binding SPASM domain